jgi:thioredoxin reductase
MAVETPARIAILGAGPIGLEAALYARYLGYYVDLYERGRVCEHLLHWGHAQLFTPFAANSSPLGIAAISAQDSVWKPPASDTLISGREFVERYCLPLARSDLLADSVHEGLEVLGVGRGELLKGELAGEERAEADFRLLVRSVASEHESAAEKVVAADVVIDATGTYGQHNWLGRGGLPALGELAAAPHIDYGLPDVLGRDRQHYAHRHTLLIGENHEAAGSAISLSRLGHEAPYTRITWIARGESETNAGPIHRFDNDPWPARDQLARSANQLIRGEIGHLTFWPGTVVEQATCHGTGEPFHVHLGGQHAGEIDVDRIVANVGHRPNWQICAELQVAEDPLNEAPTRWLTDQQPGHLITREPDFYVLGAKSAGRDARFTIADGLNQIRQLFTIIGDRPDLDLYRGQGPAARGQP